MAEQFLRRTWAEIDLDALRQNFENIRCHVTAGCRTMAIVKANAYGHGVSRCARVLADAGADWFGVSNVEEAIELRRLGIAQPILILSYTPPQQAAVLARYDITQTVVSADHAAELSAAAVEAGVSLAVHIAVDTGMTRVGFPYNASSTEEDIAAACALPALKATGIFTHFAVADEPDGEAFTREQYARFMRLTEALAARGIVFELRHCCNSAATVRFPDMHLDMVRPGLIMYGLMPDSTMRSSLQLSPVMSLKTAVSQVKSVAAGETVSYGRTYTAPTNIRTATVAIGYADGFPRGGGDRHVMLRGKLVPVIGRVCMDQTVLDASAVEQAAAGDVALIFGRDGENVRPVEAYAAECDTIHYEIICAVGRRVPRIFVQGGTAIDEQNELLD